MKRKPLSVSSGCGLGETRTEIMQRKKKRYRGISQTKEWKCMGSSGSRFLSPASAKLCVYWLSILPLQHIQHSIWGDEAALDLKLSAAPSLLYLPDKPHSTGLSANLRRAQQKRKILSSNLTWLASFLRQMSLESPWQPAACTGGDLDGGGWFGGARLLKTGRQLNGSFSQDGHLATSS